MQDQLRATLRASMLRRYLGVGTLAALGGLLLHSGFTTPPEGFLWQALLIAVAVAALAAAQRMWRATAQGVELTEAGLMTTDGELIAAIDNIETVERGVFAFKPSNGFILRLKKPVAPKWQPGVWWRYGYRVGVGGVTSAGQAKVMADLLATHLAERQTTPR